MNVYLASAAVPEEYSENRIFGRQLADQRSPQHHCQVDDPSAADLVLFTDCHTLGESDWTLRGIRSTHVARQFPHKVGVYNERDRPWCSLPGVYVSMPASGFVPR